MQLHESSFMASLETTSPWINDFWTHVLRSHWKSSAHLFPMRKCTNIHQQSCLLIPIKATRPDRAKLVAKRPRQGLGVGRHKPSVLGDSTDRAHGGLLRQVAREVPQGVPRASLNPLPCHLLFWSSCPADLAILCSQPMPWPQSPGSDGGSAACQATVPCALMTLQAGSSHKICVFSFAISSPRILQGHRVPVSPRWTEMLRVERGRGCFHRAHLTRVPGEMFHGETGRSRLHRFHTCSCIFERWSRNENFVVKVLSKHKTQHFVF